MFSTTIGGLGLKMLDEVIVGEELAYGCTGISTAVATNMLAVSYPSYYVLLVGRHNIHIHMCSCSIILSTCTCMYIHMFMKTNL